MKIKWLSWMYQDLYLRMYTHIVLLTRNQLGVRCVIVTPSGAEVGASTWARAELASQRKWAVNGGYVCARAWMLLTTQGLAVYLPRGWMDGRE
jgi:hypothetical protein